MQSTVPELSAAEAMAASAVVWPRWKRVAFRFVFIYWALYMLPEPRSASLFDVLPWLSTYLDMVFGWPLATLARWVGVHLFHLSGEAAQWHPTGSGDTALNYVLTFCVAVIALVAATVWSAVSETRGRRREYTTAYAWLRLLLRFTLGYTLVVYGLVKVVPLQFPAPRLGQLLGTYGNSTPMHVLWTFMGVSVPYIMFSGSMELIAGVLLFFRRTSTLGAMAAAAVMTNVVMLNLCYDVPVKLYSMHLLLMALFLLLPDFAPMWNFFVLRDSAALSGVWVRKSERKPLRIGAHVLQALVIGFAVIGTFVGVFGERPGASPVERPAIYGIWAVDSTTGLTGTDVWKTFVVDDGGSIRIVYSDGLKQGYAVKVDNKAQTLSTVNVSRPGQLHWARDASGELTLTGTFGGKAVTATMHDETAKFSMLRSRGFHWVQEKPVNHD